jgi:hypothetical protein
MFAKFVSSSTSVSTYLDPKYICETRPAIISKGAKNEVLALLIEDQYAREHLEERNELVLKCDFEGVECF